MQSKNTVLEKLNTLVNGAVGAGFDKTKLDALVAPLKQAITTYYSAVTKDSVETCVFSMTHCLIRTGMVYEDGTTYPMSGNVPTGFNDLTLLAVAEQGLYSCGSSSFNSKIVVVEDTVNSTTYYTSTLVDSWTASFTTGAVNISEGLTNISDYADNQGHSNSLYFLYDAKNIKTVPKLSDIAKDIYQTRKYKAFIDAFGLSVYVPVVIRG